MKLFKFFKKGKVTAKEQGGTSGDSLQKSAVAAAFAEAGEHSTAREMLQESSGPCKILAIGNEDKFSPELMEYAIQMAKRLNCQILAVSASNAPMSLPRPHRELACKAFEESAAKNLDHFHKLAKLNGVELTHLIRFGEQDDIISRLYKEENGQISYVITEPDPELVDTADGRLTIPVFGLAHSGAM